MTAFLFFFFLLAQAPAAQAPAAAAGQPVGQNVTGLVTNGTTGQPLGGAHVTLVQLQGGMQPVAQTSTDAAGRYRFSENLPGPFLVEVDFNAVPYFAQVAPGQSETNVQVFNTDTDPSAMTLDAEIMVLQPENGQLAVVDEYRVENAQPRTLYRPGGLFRFRVPPGAQVDGAHAEAPSPGIDAADAMPIAVEPKPTGDKSVYSIDYPFRPGETKIQVAYRIPYPGFKAALRETPLFPTAHFEAYVPAPISFQGPGFSQVGAQQGYKVYGITTSPLPHTLEFTIAGDAPMPAAPADGAPGDSAVAPASAASPAAAPAGTVAGAVPTKTFLERNLWSILALLAIAAAAGFGILLALPAVAPVDGAPMDAAPRDAAPTAPAAGVGDDDLKRDLNRLKDDLFLLEVRRHTGNLSDAEYTRLRAELNARLDHLAAR